MPLPIASLPVRIALGLACASPLPAAAAQDLLRPELRDLFHEELSGELAKESVIAITRHHRIQASRGYRDAANELLGNLRGLGLGEDRAWIESFPSDGVIEYQTWQSPSGWDVDFAELRMVEPYAERIVGYPEVAMSLVTYSNAGEATAELVDVGRGTSAADYEGKDVAGKFVLATGYGGAVHRLAVLEHGAAGVVCFLDDARALEYPDMLAYTGMWPRADELADTTFGFNLTHRQGTKLRRLLAAGRKVVLHGKVEGTGLEPFEMDVVVARIPGSEFPEEEIVFSAHLDHPKESANDNASGSAALLDMVRALDRLIADDRLPAPKRTLTFLWVPEWHGTMAYLDAHEELAGPALGGKVLANLNLDMVGEHLELLHSKLVLTRTPDSVPSALNDVIEDMAKMVDGVDVRTPRGSLSAFNWRVIPYGGGSDHMMFLDRKIPAVMFSHSPDYTHHTSEDTPDKVDPVQLERCELLATGAGWYLANLAEDEALDLVALVSANSARRLSLAYREARTWLQNGTEQLALASLNDADVLLERAWRRERMAVFSVTLFHDSAAVQASVARANEGLMALRDDLRKRLFELDLPALVSGESDSALTAEAAPASLPRPDLRVPERLTRGPLAFSLPESELPAERAAWYASDGFPFTSEMRFELVNFADGRNSVAEIRNGLTAEFHPVEQEDVARYLEDLASIGVLRWRTEDEE